MFQYRVKYTESESDIKNYNFFYKNTNNAKKLSIFRNFRKIEKFKKIKMLFCIMYKLYNSILIIFGTFVSFVIFGFLDFYLCTRIRVGLFMSWWRGVVVSNELLGSLPLT